MARRTLLLIASILVAALGTALIWLYVQGADSRAQAGEAKVEVLVASGSVAAGTPAAQFRPLIVRRTLPQSFVSSFGADLITDPKDIAGYTTTPLIAGMPLTRAQFAAVPAAPAPAVALDPQLIAMQVSLPDPQRLAGLLQPGMFVRIYVTEKTSKTVSTTKVLLPKVRVLASGPVTSTSAGGGGNGAGTKADVPQAIVTLELEDGDVKRLVSTQSQDSGGRNLWFGLLGAKADTSTSQDVKTTNPAG